MLGFLSEALRATQYRVLVAAGGEAAIRLLERVTPDMILIDTDMPEMDGFETCRRMKAVPAVAQVPVMFMTGLNEAEDVLRAFDCGGIDCISRPIDVEELSARVRVHLTHARRAQSARAALDAAGQHLLALTSAATLVWATPLTIQLLEAPPGQGAQLPLAAIIRHWARRRGGMARLGGQALSSSIAGRSLQITCMGSIGPDEYLFRLAVEGGMAQQVLLRGQFGLTNRESEVLVWIARGKANRDIGEILGLSPRTVNKHLEQVYAKLGVENRASAAVRAMQVLAGAQAV
jgi:DNA-binding NarL/FixJ family response regulator